jgi:ribonuclease R
MSLPHRSQLLELLAQAGRPLHVAEIAGRLGQVETAMHALTAMLDDMVLTGAVRAFPGHRYRIAHDVSEVESQREGARSIREREGIFSMNPRGFGFVSSPGTGAADAFINPEAIGGALHGDRVRIRIGRTTARGTEGEIVAVVARAVTRVPGTIRQKGRSAWLEPDDTRMRGPIPFTVPGEQPGAPRLSWNDGMAGIVKLTRYPTRNDELPEGELLQVLGLPGEPTVELAKILAREEVIETFPDAVVAEARAYGDAITDAQIEGREDLRPLPLVTIDPKDARDHDDAVFVRRATEHDGEDAAYVAWIAIADVAEYVRPGTALDEEALRRGCSVYLPDRAIPMLPRELSTHLCSLVADQDRLCLAVEVTLDATGLPLRHRLVEGVMRNRAKLAYEDVARVLGFVKDEEPLHPSAVALKPDLEVAWELSSLLRGVRMRRGALDFDLPEAKVVLDATGRCVDVIRARGNPGIKKAYNLIEELMLLANEVVAEDLTGKTVPTVYRVHGVPDEAKLDRFASVAETMGVPFDVELARDPKALGKFLKAIATHEQANVLNSLLLRAMKQATYDVVNIGHYGLASKAYLHFTSPIRRYPDLVVHRAVHRLVRGVPVARDHDALEALKEAALLASSRERKAMDVEREVVDLHRAILMQAHLDEVKEGTVTALVGSGIFVALDQPYVDVLVKFDSLGEGWELDEEGITAFCQRSGESIRLGDRMMVRIEEVSIPRRSVYGSRLASSATSAKGAKGAARGDRGERGTKGREQGRDKGGRKRVVEAAPPSRGGKGGAKGKVEARPSKPPKGRKPEKGKKRR